MPYQFLDDVATADIAFQATGRTLKEMFGACADATTNVMVEDLETIEPQLRRSIHLEHKDIEMLLFQFLQELIYFKDAENLLLRMAHLNIIKKNDIYQLKAEAKGEAIDPHKHRLSVDIKAVTFHRFKIEKTEDSFKATVVLDI